MIEPKKIKITSRMDPILRDLPEGPINCILQHRQDGDESLIVYIVNPYHKKGSKDDPITSAPYIALTQYDYEVVEWTK